MFSRNIESLKKTPLSDHQMENLTGCRVILYSDLKNYNSLDEVFRNEISKGNENSKGGNNKTLSPFDLVNNAVIILYLQTDNYGHWCALLKTPLENGRSKPQPRFKPATSKGEDLKVLDHSKSIIEFFDPYGLLPDKELNWNSYEKNIKLGQDEKRLSFLMLNSPYRLSYNEYKFQKSGANVATCGYHVAFRLLNSDLSLKNYKAYLDKMIKKHEDIEDYDMAVIIGCFFKTL